MHEQKHISPEMRLLLECARMRSLKGAEAGSTKPSPEAISEVKNWSSFLTLTRDHHLVPMVYKALRSSRSSGISAEIMKELRSLKLRIASLNFLLTHKLAQIADTMAKEHIPFMVIKGPALAVQAYGSTSERQYGDLDLIVQRADMRRTDSALQKIGYYPHKLNRNLPQPFFTKSLREITYAKNESVFLDLHPLVSSHGISNLSMTEAFFTRKTPLNIDNIAHIYAPSLIDHMIIVAMNGAEEMWKKLSDVVDIMALASKFSDADMQAAIKSASELGQKRSVLIGLQLTRLLINNIIPGEVDSEIKKDRKACRLAAQAAKRLLSGLSTKPDGVRERMFEIRSREKLTHKARAIFRYALTPGLSDYQALHLPPALHCLYYVLRPMRMVTELFRSLKK